MHPAATHSSELEALAHTRAKQIAHLESLECQIYDAEGAFLTVLNDIGTFISRVPVVPRRPFKRSHFHYEVNEGAADQGNDGRSDDASDTHTTATSKRPVQVDYEETFLGSKHDAVRRQALVAARRGASALYFVDDNIRAREAPSAAISAQHSPSGARYAPLACSFHAVPMEGDRIASMSSLTALPAVEKHRRFVTASRPGWRSRECPGICRYTPFAAFPTTLSLAERKRDATSADANDGKFPLKKEKRTSFWRNPGVQ
ncbi:outer-membrane protein [Perkinsela sp. CCAP 1560/4]|nr:outer-membrane protein [Perkinsela sp. CCAP 1560/4]KNH08676.1 outer-membrane protein [Perkinsela sp. CCAP 1560/4]|eukprot:KNH04613.1 outer-membrane protein [Perkinsela sp. CCAP 1560/4]